MIISAPYHDRFSSKHILSAHGLQVSCVPLWVKKNESSLHEAYSPGGPNAQ